MLQKIVNLIPAKLRWMLWWLIRPKYTVGVFVGVFAGFGQDNDPAFVLAVQKKLGIGGTSGLTLPGGGKNYKESIKQAAVRELKEETGFVVKEDELMLVQTFNETNSRDIVILFLYFGSSISVFMTDFKPSFEIFEMKWINIKDMERLMDPKHLELARVAYGFWEDSIKLEFSNTEA